MLLLAVENCYSAKAVCSWSGQKHARAHTHTHKPNLLRNSAIQKFQRYKNGLACVSALVLVSTRSNVNQEATQKCRFWVSGVEFVDLTLQEDVNICWPTVSVDKASSYTYDAACFADIEDTCCCSAVISRDFPYLSSNRPTNTGPATVI